MELRMWTAVLVYAEPADDGHQEVLVHYAMDRYDLIRALSDPRRDEYAHIVAAGRGVLRVQCDSWETFSERWMS